MPGEAGTDEADLTRRSRALLQGRSPVEEGDGENVSLEASRRELTGTYRLLFDPRFSRPPRFPLFLSERRRDGRLRSGRARASEGSRRPHFPPGGQALGRARRAWSGPTTPLGRRAVRGPRPRHGHLPGHGLPRLVDAVALARLGGSAQRRGSGGPHPRPVHPARRAAVDRAPTSARSSPWSSASGVRARTRERQNRRLAGGLALSISTSPISRWSLQDFCEGVCRPSRARHQDKFIQSYSMIQ